jgi:hypothetical protein
MVVTGGLVTDAQFGTLESKSGLFDHEPWADPPVFQKLSAETHNPAFAPLAILYQ